ncbi:cytochrome P450 [Cyanobium sp. ATX 6A2]|uniref:cytochrome P450 n=1 Tax=Cyanobium sp. ATX 6A2 TaxID=2823700 RepID=UPI0020CDCF53|nr:cytochrome P450 [Cyanobium sp. ATX 6A2]MCP9886764.1 cytochrome P450 [Cyanobium sp. ATX 6A2]
MTAGPPRPLPGTGAASGILETLAFFRDPGFARRRFERHGNVFETRLLGQPLVFIRGERAITNLLAHPQSVRGWWPASVRELLGSRSLANRNGADHRARRRVVGQLFAAAALRRYSPAIVALVEELVAELAQAREPLALAERLRRFAFTVIATVVLGLEGDDREALFADFEIWTKGLFAFPLAIPGSPFARALAARARLLERLGVVLRRAQAQAAAGEPLAAGGLDLLAGGLDEVGLPLADDDVVEQLLLLLFAGYETTASSLSCLMLALLQHPLEEAWLRQELAGLSWPPAPELATTAYDPSRAPRLDAVVMEVMRLTPPVGGFFRRTTAPLVLDGVLVPADRVVQVALAAHNRHGEANLETFRPQRHLEGSCPVALLPFGGGERVCLGRALAELEIRLLAVGLLRGVELELVPGQNLELQVIPSPSPRDGLLVCPRMGWRDAVA